jgi:hypothetical protein
VQSIWSHAFVPAAALGPGHRYPPRHQQYLLSCLLRILAFARIEDQRVHAASQMPGVDCIAGGGLLMTLTAGHGAGLAVAPHRVSQRSAAAGQPGRNANMQTDRTRLIEDQLSTIRVRQEQLPGIAGQRGGRIAEVRPVRVSTGRREPV